MRFTTFFLPLAFAFAANAIDISIGPDTVCGDNSVDCNNGFCCSAGSTCNTSGSITKCGNDGTLAKPFDAGSLKSAIESQVKSLGSLPSALASEFASVVQAFPTEVASSARGVLSSFIANQQIPTGSALSSFVDSLPTSAQAPARSALSSLQAEVNDVLGAASSSGSNQPQNTNAEGGAAPGASATFGHTAALMVGIWGVAALGGAMLVL